MSNVWTVALAACAVTLASGLGAIYLRAHRALVYAFCSGALVGGAIIFLLPDARDLLQASGRRIPPDLLWLACAVAFLFFYLFERSNEGSHSARIAGLTGALGLATHSFLDGVVIGQGFRAGEAIGLALAAAVMLHKLADGVSAVGVMLGTEHGMGQTATMLLVTALAPVLGVLAQSLVVLPNSVLAFLLSVFAGMLLYLGASRLLPEARRASPSVAVPILSLGGVAFVAVAHMLSR